MCRRYNGLDISVNISQYRGRSAEGPFGELNEMSVDNTRKASREEAALLARDSICVIDQVHDRVKPRIAEKQSPATESSLCCLALRCCCWREISPISPARHVADIIYHVTQPLRASPAKPHRQLPFAADKNRRLRNPFTAHCISCLVTTFQRTSTTVLR